MTAEQAIKRSAEYDEIVTLDAYSEAALETLCIECDDNVLANGRWEFWADDEGDDEKMAWRVHMPAARKAVV